MADNTARQLKTDFPDLESYWMPFTGNRYFKENPRMIARAEGMYCYTTEGKKLLDGVAGLWCCNAGHCNPKIVEAIKSQAEKLDYSMSVGMNYKLSENALFSFEIATMKYANPISFNHYNNSLP